MFLGNDDRVRALVQAPGRVAPQTVLTTTKEIRRAIDRNLNGGNYGVYCSNASGKYRICDVRTRKGQIEVKLLNSGSWVTPDSVFVEG